MRSRLVSDNAIIHYQMLLNSMGSHLCTKILFRRTFFSFQILCGYISASQTGTDKFFMVI